MPRSNASRSRERSGRTITKGFEDKEIAEIVATGKRSESGSLVTTDHFTRNLRGFSLEASELLLGNLRDHIVVLREGIVIPIGFIGISENPYETFEVHGPSLFQTRSRFLVISGNLSFADTAELGVDSITPIARAENPIVDAYYIPDRLNVAVGPNPGGFNVDRLSRALGNVLEVSEIVEINDEPVPEAAPMHDIIDMWHRPPTVDSPGYRYYW